MKQAAVVVFPGSNCDRDIHHVIGDVLGMPVTYHWYTDPVRMDYSVVVLPGGFAYGDYLRAGALAKISPAVESLGPFIEKGGAVLGICNGFQILCEAGILPGALVKNRSLQFQSEDVYVRVESSQPPFFSKPLQGQVLKMPIAHSEGRYIADEATLQRLKQNGQIVLRYVGPYGETDDCFNANGSTDAIAGITNEKGNVLGFMPHPERNAEAVLGNGDGYKLLEPLRHLR